jgi:3-hydroxyisobutyrate dehydrogenase
MAENVLRAGFPIVAYNRSAARREAFVASGGRTAGSPREVGALSDIVVTMVSDTPDVEEVVFGLNGAAESMSRGSVLVDMSTISPRATRDLARRLSERGVDYLDAPVSGGESGAMAATLSIMVGGDAAAFERCRPLFAVLGKRVTHLGLVGSGQSTKLVNQVAVLGNLLATCEAIRLGAEAGLDLRKVIEAVGAGAGASWQLTNLGPKIVERDFAPGFPVRLARKDLRLILETAEDYCLPLPGVALVQQLFSAIAAIGGEDGGTQALIEVFDRLTTKPQ